MIQKTLPITGKLIINAIQITEQLLQKLNAEAGVLKVGKPALMIQEFANQKQELVSQLNRFSTQLSQILATEKLPQGIGGIKQYFILAKNAGLATDEITQQWSKLSSLSKKCRRLNEQNGASIELLSRHTERALHIIKGKPLVANTYGPDGTTKSDLYSRPLISV